MADYKEIQTRIQLRHDTEANWNYSTLIPIAGEVIIYDPDYDAQSNTSGFKYPRFKVGDGKHTPSELLFASMPDVNLQLADYTDAKGYFLEGFRIKNDGTIEGSFSNNISGTAATADKLNTPYVLYPDAEGYGDFTLNLSQGATSETESHSLVHINFPAYGDVNASASIGGYDDSIVDVDLVAEEKWHVMDSISTLTPFSNLSETIVTFTFAHQYLPQNYTHFSMDLAIGYGDVVEWRMLPSCLFELSGELGADGLAWQAFRKYDENLNAYVREITYDSNHQQSVLRIRIGFKPDSNNTQQSYFNTVASRPTVGCFPTAKYAYSGYYLAAEHLAGPVSDFCISKSSIPKNLIPVDLDDWKALEALATDGIITETHLKDYAKKDELPEVPETVSAFTNDAMYVANGDNGILLGNSTGGAKDAIHWEQKSAVSPFIGYAQSQNDGTFLIASIETEDGQRKYTSGLAIGGTSKKLFWKGNEVATTNMIPTVVNGGTV